MKYIDRNHSVITSKRTLTPLQTFRNFPVYIGTTDKPQLEDVLADLSVAIDTETGVMQLDKVLPLEVVYSQYHSEALGGVWTEHHHQFIEFIGKYAPKNVLEIGGSNGYIASRYLDAHPDTKWVMVEPTPATEDKRIEVIAKSFDNDFTYQGEINAIIHSHTFEHIYEPAEFIKQISTFLKDGDYHLFTVPNLYKYLENRYANWMNFEHTVFLSEFYIDYFLNELGFETLEKKYYEEHSIFYATRKKSKRKKSPLTFDGKFEENKALFTDFMSYYGKLIKEFNKEIKEFKGEVYLFGAHIFSQFLLHQGLDQRIVRILDNSKLKHGKRLYGTKHFVSPLELIAGKEKVAVILKAGAYQEEVRSQLNSINPNVMIIE